MIRCEASYAQTYFWAAARRAQRMQNVSVCFDVRGPLNASALERALNAVVARHESLRTVLTCSEGEVQQVVRPGADLRLHRCQVVENTRVVVDGPGWVPVSMDLA